MQPQYQKLKNYISARIEHGEWREGQKVSSENELARRFGVSRMTANRALRELTSEGVLTRIAGVGTFVAEAIPQAPLFEIRDIAEEIRDRGHVHRLDLVLLERTRADAEIAAQMALPAGADVFHSIAIHRENGVPVQLEERFVNPVTAPGYIDQDFSDKTPSDYLIRATPLSEAEHIIEAVAPDPETAALLELDGQEPCLLLRRRTWSGAAIATCNRLIHPGKRYRIGGRFVPEGTPQGPGRIQAVAHSI